MNKILSHLLLSRKENKKVTRVSYENPWHVCRGFFLLTFPLISSRFKKNLRMLFKAKITYSEPEHFTTFDIAAVCHCLGGDPFSLDYRLDKNKELEFGSFDVSLSKDEYEKIIGDCTKFKHLDAEARVLYDNDRPIDFICVVSRLKNAVVSMIEVDFVKQKIISIRTRKIQPDTLYLAFFQRKDSCMLTCEFGVTPGDVIQDTCVFSYLKKHPVISDDVRKIIFDTEFPAN